MARGEKLLKERVQDGTPIASAALGSSWGITRQALDQAVERGELFSLKIAGRRYYLAELRDITREQAAQVCCALGQLSPGEKLMFWLHAHGGLQGRTPVVAIQAWACERTHPDGRFRQRCAPLSLAPSSTCCSPSKFPLITWCACRGMVKAGAAKLEGTLLERLCDDFQVIVL